MKKNLLTLLMLSVACATSLCATEKITWESLGTNFEAFKEFQSYWRKSPLPDAQEEKCPESFSAITLTPESFSANLGEWSSSTIAGANVLQAKYGHGITVAQAPLKVEEPGVYRVWVKFFHVKDYASSFSLRIVPADSKKECYAHNFDWCDPKEGSDTPDMKHLPTGFMWEDGPMVELAPGDYTIELSTVVHGGPFTFRKVATVVLTADPLLEGLDEVAGQSSYLASDLIRQAWNAWAQRPGALSWEALTDAQKQYYISWLSASKFADDKGKDELVEELKRDGAKAFGLTVEVEDMEQLNGWSIKDSKGASGKILEAPYADGLASAKVSVDIPKEGKYYVWVRHFLHHKYYSIFEVEFASNAGKKLATLKFGDPKDRLERKDYQFTWECLPVDLPAGKLNLNLTKNIGKSPYTFRRVDKIFVTDSSTATPDTF